MRIFRINKLSLISIAVVCISGYLLHYFSSMPLWGAILIVVVAFVGNGFLAEWEDNRLGGFNNPKPSSKENDKDI